MFPPYRSSRAGCSDVKSNYYYSCAVDNTVDTVDNTVNTVNNTVNTVHNTVNSVHDTVDNDKTVRSRQPGDGTASARRRRQRKLQL